MDIERTSELESRAKAHAALADVTRLQILDLLTIGDASASEIGAALNVASNLLAHHLKVLEQAHLVTRRRSEGDGRRSYLSLGPAAHPDISGGSVLGSPARVVFVCTANTARSHLAAALWRQASVIPAISAGTHPGDRIHPGAVKVADRHDLALPDAAPQLLDRVQRGGDLIITVCDRAHEELDGLGWAHWSVPDPVPASTKAAFDDAYGHLASRVAALAPRLAPAS
ncbi:Protein-tyrosine-phosphatase [Pedococcus dokdonensis]|uniref:Protein-tyrosine-phosphatase n=1 Tax=Pedococcus dokdonensis TaxID=443156 RepID=A0A1H0SFW6_9MICO|nr:ArsR family transcriptional regulator [Pedococcus dokdonensis]SDP40643.1 Protein-tyrosine-phosphatase [Pedococcus dokdonensis]